MKPFDLTKFKKEFTKKTGIKTGFHDPVTWIDTGSYVLNYRISGDFFKGVPLEGKITTFAGESGSGKSYIVSGNMIKWCQNNNVQVILMDSEDAVDRSWVKALGVNPEMEENIIRIPVSSPDDCATAINDLMSSYDAQYKDVPRDECPKILFVIDSLGMLSTKVQQNQFEEGEMKGDKGIKAKELKALATQCLRLFNGKPVGLVATNHSYKSQDMYNPEDVIGGGQGFVYASSVVVAMNKSKLKEDENGVKTPSTQGIRAKVRVSKSRYAKPFEEVELKIPYDRGMNPYSGLIEMFEKAGLLTKAGSYLQWIDPETGEVVKKYRKAWFADEEWLHKMMRSYNTEATSPEGIDEVGDEDEDA